MTIQTDRTRELAAVNRDLPTVDVVIPCFNAERSIGGLLRALERQTYPKHIRRVVVVDDGSTDGTAAVVAGFPDVVLLRKANGGSYAARNAAMRLLRSEVIAFTDDDCTPDPDWLLAGVNALVRSGAELVGGGVRMVFTDPSSNLELYDANFHLKQEYYVNRVHFAATANLFVYRSVLESLNGFDERLRSGGDRTFGQAAYAAGYRIHYAPEALISHPTRATLRQLLVKIRRITHGKAASTFEWRHLLPRGFGNFPPGFHIPEVERLRGWRRLRFVAFHYFVDAFRIACLVEARASMALDGRKDRGRAAEGPPRAMGGGSAGVARDGD
ncbi:MAG: glycosyltransferase [Polyangiaceae bacterium]|jgi:glycosyltransferase involved in cell wall biosynthesis